MSPAASPPATALTTPCAGSARPSSRSRDCSPHAPCARTSTALAAIAALSQDELDLLLLSADRFTHPDETVRPPLEVRRALLDRFGGVRAAAVGVAAAHGLRDAPTLADQLVARSGLVELRRVLATQFSERRDVLGALALIALERVLTVDPQPGAAPLAAEVERILAATHDFAELRLLSDLRWRVVKLPREQAEEAERLLGGQGGAAAARYGRRYGTA